MVSGLQGSSYEEKLKEIGLLSLEDRRLQYYLVQTFKITRGFDQVDLNTWFTLVGNNPARITRETSDPINIVRQVVGTEIWRHFFSNRVIENWNSLPSEIKLSRSVHSFKLHILTH